jgi:hypothetical protein
MTDKIIYKVVTNGGGIDGRDSSDKGGTVKFASLVREEAEKKVDAWSTLKVDVIQNFEEEAKKALTLLDPVERLLIEWEISEKSFRITSKTVRDYYDK